MDPENNDSPEAPEAEVCFKCKAKISHVPYKFEGKCFHARCLLCNTCGKRLIGKPFVAAENQIFCNNKCQEQFNTEGPIRQQVSEVHSNNLLPPPHRQTNGFHNIPNFSLNGLLDKMHNHTYLYHNQGIDHTHNQIGEGRVTDYPIAYIGNHGNQSFQSETDSLSTYSESSFTSDSSFAYDANRKPKKKILKKSNGASRSKHKRRVTWNLDHLESFSDVDSISIDSSSSISSCGPSYRLPGHPRRNGGGQEPGRNVTMVTEYPHYQHQGHRLFSPPPTSAATPFSNNAGFSGKNSHPGIYRTYSGSIYQPKSSGGHRHAHQTNSLDSNYSRGRSLSLSYQDLQHPPVQHSSPGSHTEGGGREKRVINVPILQLEDVPELNESNPEEREKRRLFEFPPQPNHKYPPTHCPVDLTGVPNGTGQRSRSSSYDSNPQSLTSNSSSSMSSQSNSSFSAFLPASFRNLPPAAGSPSMATTNRFQGNFPLKCVPEDEPDYDHLEDNSPKISGKKTAKYHLEPCIPNNQWYSNDDIEEALQILEESEQESGDERGPPPSSSSTPPPVPPKQRRIVRNPPPVLVKKPHLKNLPKPISLSTKKRDDTKTGVLSLSPAPQRPRGSNVDHLVKPDPLHSPSSETLMPVDASQSDSNLTPLEAEVHPKVNGNCSPKLSWSNPMDDRIIEGAEDLRQSPTHIPVNPSTGFITKSNTIHVDSVGKLAKNMEGLKTADQSSSPLQRHNSFSPTRQQKESSESPRHHQLQRSRTLPRNLGLSKEDEAVLQWYRRRPQMKPLIVDTDKEIDEMMEEMEREKGTPHQARRQPVEPQPPQTIGKCASCNKLIDNPASLVNFASQAYHTSCFCCSHCRCLLKGTQVYTLQGVLMCSSDYNTIMAKQQKEQLSKISKAHKLKNRSHSSSSLLSSKTRGDIVISPPIQSLKHTFNKNTTMV